MLEYDAVHAMQNTVICSGVRWAFNCSTWNPSKQEWLLACSCVQKEEKERLLRFVHAKDAKLSMGGQLLARKAVVQLIQLPNKAISLGRNDKGKPYLLDPVGQDVQFNISHDGNYVVLAAERGRKVGVDMMQVTRPVGSASTSQFFHQMKRQFTENEWTQILCHPDECQQLMTFFRIWCLKESYIKAIGAGIGMGLQRMDFILPSVSNSQGVKTGSKLKLDGQLLNDWKFEESYIDPEHCVCVAIADCRTTTPHGFSEIDFDKILSSLEPLHWPDHNDWETFVNKL